MTAASTDEPAEALLADDGADAAARGALYGLLAAAFDAPDPSLHAALADGSFEATVAELLDRTALDVAPPTLRTDDDADTLSARYHDLFVVGLAGVEDATTGSGTAAGPPVPLYESSHRTDVAWGEVNLDLARAYDYYGLAVDGERRDHHDSLRLQLAFAGFLARREAAVDGSAAGARLGLLDRHLRAFVPALAERLAAEPGTGVYGPLAELLEAFTAADRADLADRPGVEP